MSALYLFEDVFEVQEANPDGKFFDKVTRYKCKSELYAADLTLDVNSSIYPLAVSGRYTMRMSMTLLPDVALQKDEYDAELLREKNPKPSMMDDFDYVMHGKVYKLDREKSRGQESREGSVRTQVYVSFGGLLCCLTADHENLQSFELDSMVYLLVRRL